MIARTALELSPEEVKQLEQAGFILDPDQQLAHELNISLEEVRARKTAGLILDLDEQQSRDLGISVEDIRKLRRDGFALNPNEQDRVESRYAEEHVEKKMRSIMVDPSTGVAAELGRVSLSSRRPSSLNPFAVRPAAAVLTPPTPVPAAATPVQIPGRYDFTIFAPPARVQRSTEPKPGTRKRKSPG